MSKPLGYFVDKIKEVGEDRRSERITNAEFVAKTCDVMDEFYREWESVFDVALRFEEALQLKRDINGLIVSLAK